MKGRADPPASREAMPVIAPPRDAGVCYDSKCSVLNRIVSLCYTPSRSKTGRRPAPPSAS